MSYHPAEYVIQEDEPRDTQIAVELDPPLPKGPTPLTPKGSRINRRPNSIDGPPNDGDTSPRGDKEPLEDRLVFTNFAWHSWVPSAIFAVLCVAAAVVVMSIIMFERSWYVSLTLLAFGLIFALRARSETYVFDNLSHRFHLRRRQLFNSLTLSISYQDIKEVRLAENTDTQGGTEVEVFLLLRTGKKIQIITGNLCGLMNVQKRNLYKQIARSLQGAPSSAKPAPRFDRPPPQ